MRLLSRWCAVCKGGVGLDLHLDLTCPRWSLHTFNERLWRWRSRTALPYLSRTSCKGGELCTPFSGAQNAQVFRLSLKQGCIFWSLDHPRQVKASADFFFARTACKWTHPTPLHSVSAFSDPCSYSFATTIVYCFIRSLTLFLCW